MRCSGVVVIGRNEGESLRRCLESVVRQSLPVVYVDSGSTDGSVALASSLGVGVVELDLTAPFTASRARNEGVEFLLQQAPRLTYVQFIDGDCEMTRGWLERGEEELNLRPDAAIVCGRLRERFPERSIYNRIADLEWDTPIGEVESCGGIAMIRLEAFRASGGFDPSLAAGEEPELCLRLRRVGWKILRLDAEMALHDMAMTHFGQWWRRTVRSGYGGLDVTHRVGGRNAPFSRQVRSARLWTLGWIVCMPAAGFLTSLLFGSNTGKVATLLIATAPVAQTARLALRARARKMDVRGAIAYGGLTMIGKWAQLSGQVRLLNRRVGGRQRKAGWSVAPEPGLALNSEVTDA